MKTVALILTFNEQTHLARCIDSLQGIADTIIVVDSFSTDNTVQIAATMSARVIQHEFVHQAAQFNWALNQLEPDTEWVLRIDADEVLTPELVEEIKTRLPLIGPSVDGIYWGRRMTFQGRLIRHGGVFPVKVLRLFRFGRGRCEDRWMDEHIKVAGQTVHFAGEMIDDNLNPLSWWIEKHNRYSSREALELLNLEYEFMPLDTVASIRGGGQAGFKRWLKENVYFRMPAGIRALVYFFYRYIFHLGFLDGQVGTAFHFFQGFWYRYLVDVKVREVKRDMDRNGHGVQDAILHVLGIKV